MRILSKIALGAALLLVVGAMIQPTWGSCTTARTIGSSGAYLVSNPDWGGAGGTRTCTFGYGCYQTDPGGGAQRAPISANFSGSFWAFPGFGIPGPGGVDNGTWGVENWSKQVTADFGQPYYYAAFLTTVGGDNGVAGNNPSWASSALVDGCITDTFNPGVIDAEECTCVLLTDEWDGVGYFAVYSSFTSGIGDFDITPTLTDPAGAPTIRLSPMPQPLINDSVPSYVCSVAATPCSADADCPATEKCNVIAESRFVVGAGAFDPIAIQTDGACDCGAAFKTYAWRTGSGGLAPTSRDTYCATADQLDCWGEALALDGSEQAPTPLNGKADAQVRVDCSTNAEDLYLSTRLIGDPASAGGFAAGNVSQNSFQVACGDTSNIAEPNRPDRDDPRGRSDQAPRGRDNNRGRGNR